MNLKLIGIGEVLWDLLPQGCQLGGAPANFVCHAHALGASVELISRVGNDDLGREVLRRLAERGVSTQCLAVDPLLPTGTVAVEVAPDGQPRFEIRENVAWDALNMNVGAQRVVARANAVCFGTLAQRRQPSRSAIHSLVATAPKSALRVFDVNLRQNFFSREGIEESLSLANALKLNETELPKLAELLELRGNERSQIAELASRFDLRFVAYTRGARGSLLFDGRWSDHRGIKTKVVDSIGAGDAFTAAITLGFLERWDLDIINEQANRVAAYVCSCPGATPELPEQLQAPFRGI